jgi:hypothetical protein
MASKLIHVITNRRISFSFKAKCYSDLCYLIFFIHPFTDGNLGCSKIFPGVNGDAMSISSWFWFQFFWTNIPKLNCIVILFFFFWGTSILFSSSYCTDLHSHQCIRVPMAPHPCQQPLSLVFLIIARHNIPICEVFQHWNNILVFSDISCNQDKTHGLA